MSPTRLLTPKTLRQFLAQVLTPYEPPKEVADAVTEHLLDANLYGVDSHGLQQIIGYDKSLKSGRINPNPQLTTVMERPCLVHLDADRAPGHYAAQVATERAIAQARQTGVALVGVTNSNHFGMAGYYTRMMARAGLIGFATTDTNVADLAPYGGKTAVLGNNALAWGIPYRDRPIVLDMAVGAVSGGKIKHFAYQGWPIPAGWGLTATGALTEDPTQVAVNLPTSYKGAGLAFITDLLCGPLLGTAAAMFKQKAIHDGANGTGHLLGALDIAAWTDPQQFQQEVERAIAHLKAAPRLDPAQPIYYPGELEAITRETRLNSGIPVPTALLATLAEYFGERMVATLAH